MGFKVGNSIHYLKRNVNDFALTRPNLDKKRGGVKLRPLLITAAARFRLFPVSHCDITETHRAHYRSIINVLDINIS